MASPRPSPPSSRHVTAVASLPPEVVLGMVTIMSPLSHFLTLSTSEIPSDSDSSRRPSQAPSDYSCVSVSVTPSPSSPPLTGEMTILFYSK